MIPSFKYYFRPFLFNLKEKGSCRLYELGKYIAADLELTQADLQEYTKGGSISKHQSRLNYCASYLKKMNLIVNVSSGIYDITPRGKEVLDEFGEDMTLDDLRNLPEFIATQISATNENSVYVRPHIRGGKKISGYVSNKKNLKPNNPNIAAELSESYRKQLMIKDKRDS